MKEIQTSISSLIEAAGNYLDVHQFSEATSALDEVLVLIDKYEFTDQRESIELMKQNIIRKENNHKLELQTQKLKQTQIDHEKIDFENYLQDQANEIALERAQKQKKLEEFHQKKVNQRNLEQQAFTLMDEAEVLLADHEFIQAIDNYKQANLIFQSIGWNIDEKSHLERVYQVQAQYAKTIDQAEVERHRQLNQKRKVELEEQQQQQSKQSALSDIKSLLGNIKNSVPVPPKPEKYQLIGKDKIDHEMKLILSVTTKQLDETLKERKKLVDSTVKTLGAEINSAENMRREREILEKRKKIEALAAAKKKKEDEEKQKAKAEMDAFKQMIRAAAKKKENS